MGKRAVRRLCPPHTAKRMCVQIVKVGRVLDLPGEHVPHTSVALSQYWPRLHMKKQNGAPAGAILPASHTVHSSVRFVLGLKRPPGQSAHAFDSRAAPSLTSAPTLVLPVEQGVQSSADAKPPEAPKRPAGQGNRSHFSTAEIPRSVLYLPASGQLSQSVT